MHEVKFGFVNIFSKLVTLDKMPAYNPDNENQYDFHLKLCMLADINNKGALDRFELTKVHTYFNAAYERWYYEKHCLSLSDSEKQLAIASIETRMTSWKTFVDCKTESEEEWKALALMKFRDTIPYADYIANLGW